MDGVQKQQEFDRIAGLPKDQRMTAIRKLPLDERKEFMEQRLQQAGARDITLGDSEGDGMGSGRFVTGDEEVESRDIISTSEVDDPPALPPKDAESKAPPGGTPVADPQEEETPPSMRGELNLDEQIPPSGKEKPSDPAAAAAAAAEESLGKSEEKVAPPSEEKETPPEEKAAPPEEKPPAKPAEKEEPFLKAGKSIYKDRAAAEAGVAEKDATIAREQSEKELLRQENDLLKRQLEASKNGTDPKKEAAAPDAVQPDPEPTPKVEAPTNDDFFRTYDDPDKGPVAAVGAVLDHRLSQYAGLERLLPVVDVLERLALMDPVDMVESWHTQNLFSSMDDRFPELGGKWHQEGTEENQTYRKTYTRLNEQYAEDTGQSLDEICERKGRKGVDFAVQKVLEHMIKEKDGQRQPVEVATPPADPDALSVTDEPTQPGGGDKQPAGPEMVPIDQARKMAKTAAEMALESREEQSRLHGGTATETPGSKSTTKVGEMSKEERLAFIRKNPQKWKEMMLNDPKLRNMSINSLPRHRD